MKKNKILVVVLAATICLSLVLSGCGGDGASSTATATAGSTATAASTATQAATPTTEVTSAPPATTPPPPTPTPEPKPMKEAFKDDFSGDLSKWAIHGGAWTIKEGKVNIPSEPNGPKLIAKDTDFSNFVLEAEMAIIGIREGENMDASNVGFVFYTSNPSAGADAYTGYYVGINLNTVNAGRADGGWHWIEQGKSLDNPVEEGEFVKIKLEVKDGSFAFYVHDMDVPEIEFEDDEDLGTGMIGLRSWQLEAEFKNIVVSTPE